MTSEPDSKPGRRPPTIELTATEVEKPASPSAQSSSAAASPDGATAKPAGGAVLQGKLEQSNVGPAESSIRLVAIMRQFEMLQKAMNIGNELNRRAIEEVARVVT